jgi:uncharacterized protein (TIGR03435 family)
VDLTGIDGGWDFALSWSPRANLGGAAQGPTSNPAGAGAVAAEPNGAISLFDGVEKLGLKLETRKHPYPVLVIDHIEQKPTDN